MAPCVEERCLGVSTLRSRRPSSLRINTGALKSDMAIQTAEILLSIPVSKGCTRDVDQEFRLLDDIVDMQRPEGFKPRLARWNPSKDLYSEVVPYVEHCARRLDGGYINASIMPESLGRAFIAAQGPLNNTIEDFWSTVANHHVRQIVALCNDEECADYLPSEGNPLSFLGGALEVEWKGDREVTGAIRRCTYEVRHDGQRWELTRFSLGAAWSDHEVLEPSAILPLIQMVAAGPSSDPTLVHCRAGAGRTGCFIALFSLWANASRQLQKIPDEMPCVSVLQCVANLRSNRSHMVQTVEQYSLLYSAMNEWFGNCGCPPVSLSFEAARICGIVPAFKGICKSPLHGATSWQDLLQPLRFEKQYPLACMAQLA